MAVSLTMPTISSGKLYTSSVASNSNMLSKSAFLRLPSLQRRSNGNQGPSSLPKRRTLTRVEAKKQTFSSFDELLANAEKPVLVDFYATWCGPCQFMVPILDEVSTALKDQIQVVKIDTEKYPSIANQYNIEALPTFIIFRNGKPFDRFEGAMPAKQLIERVKGALDVKL